MLKCIRCNKQMPIPDHPLDVVCKRCLENNPKLTAKEKSEMNSWDHIDSFFEVYKRMKDNDWHWYKNFGCKYVELRVDMRDGGCIIRNGEGKRINPEELAWQHSEENPNPPKYGAQFDRCSKVKTRAEEAARDDVTPQIQYLDISKPPFVSEKKDD